MSVNPTEKNAFKKKGKGETSQKFIELKGFPIDEIAELTALSKKKIF